MVESELCHLRPAEEKVTQNQKNSCTVTVVLITDQAK